MPRLKTAIRQLRGAESVSGVHRSRSNCRAKNIPDKPGIVIMRVVKNEKITGQAGKLGIKVLFIY
jgi:hypothetical protein